MFGLESLDIMIGLITVYLVFGMVCTAVVEAVMSWNDVRSKNLGAALNEFLSNKIRGDGTPDEKLAGNVDFIQSFYDHPLVQSLSKGKNGRPSYVAPEIASQVIVEIIKASNEKTLEQAIGSLPEGSRIKGVLTSLYKQSSNDVKEFRQALETHFDHIMDRASGWVKRESRNITRVVAVLLVFFFNVDTITIYNSLATNPATRAKLVEIAQQQLNDITAKTPAPDDSDALLKATLDTQAAKTTLVKATNDLKLSGVQLGWQKNNLPRGVLGWLNKLIGLFISTLAVSLGAPFWFDVLQKFMQIRSSGVSPREVKKDTK